MAPKPKKVGFANQEELGPRLSYTGDRKLQPQMSLITTPLHMACEEGNIEGVKAILKSGRFDANAKDHSGSTPLHIAVRANHSHIVKFLMKKGVQMEIKDSSGETPLQVALQEGFSDILEILLDGGAEGLKIDTLPALLRARHADDNPDFFALREGGSGLFSFHEYSRIALHSKNFHGINHGDIPLREWKDKEWTARSIYILNPKRKALPTSPNIMTFSDPRTYLRGHDDSECPSQVALAEWAWLGKHKNGQFLQHFCPGLPEQQQVLMGGLKPFMLLGHVNFEVLIQHAGVGPGALGDNTLIIFQTEARTVDISWIMRRFPLVADRPKQTIMRSMHFRGSLDLKYLSIPKNGAMFVNLFLGDVHDKWRALIEGAKSHLASIRIAQFNSAGTDHTLIKGLLQDALHWNRFHALLILHLSTAKDLLNTFKTNEILFAELIDLHEPCTVDSDDESSISYDSPGNDSEDYDGDSEGINNRYGDKAHVDGHKEAPDIDRCEAIKRLAKRITRFEEECVAGIADLDRVTKEMIDLEFNLVSIFEARRSIDMSASMKRLSWITFIFLPLMFVSSLFGMNINLLAADPSWEWYIIIAGPTFALVFAVWIFCKYLPVTQWFENTVGFRLESRFGYRPAQSTAPSVHVAEDGSPCIPCRVSSGQGHLPTPEAPPKRVKLNETLQQWLRHRRGKYGKDEETCAETQTPTQETFRTKL